jgi:hypothetical protein
MSLMPSAMGWSRAGEAHAVGADAVLHPGGDAALGPDGVGHQQQHEGEHAADLEEMDQHDAHTPPPVHSSSGARVEGEAQLADLVVGAALEGGQVGDQGGEDRSGAVPGGATQAFEQAAQDFEVGAGVAGGRQRGAQALQAAVGVDQAALLLVGRGPGKQHVGAGGDGGGQDVERDQGGRGGERGLVEVVGRGVVAHHQQPAQAAGAQAGGDGAEGGAGRLGGDAGEARAAGIGIAVGQHEEPVGRAAPRQAVVHRPAQGEPDAVDDVLLLEGGAGGANDGDAAGRGGAQARGGGVERRAPVGRFAVHDRFAQAGGVVDVAGAQAALVAHPGLVDRLVVARHQAQQLRAARAGHHVAPAGAAGAEGAGFLEEPHALAEAELGGGERADRAEVDDVEIVVGVGLVAGEAGEHAAGAALDEPEAVLAGHFLHEAHAARAEDAALVVEHDLGPERACAWACAPSPRGSGTRRGRSRARTPAGGTRRPGRKWGSRAGG